MCDGTFFPTDIEHKKWISFKTSGYSNNVVGIIYKSGQTVCGLSLGGIATGCIDLDTDGTLGKCTLFNSVIPPRELGGLPFLVLALGHNVWALTTKKIEGINNAKQIFYWGHYPVADLQYELECPIKAALRSWSPFVPGDEEVSNTPGIIFEIRLRNTSEINQTVTVAMTFPGPTHEEAGIDKFSYKEISQNNHNGIFVDTGNNTGYVIAVIDENNVSTGCELTNDEKSFAHIADKLPQPCDTSTGASIAVNFTLKAGESRTIHVVLAWHYPILRDGHRSYLHAYGTRFDSAQLIAKYIIDNHRCFLKRVIAWQEVVYEEESLPHWLRDCLINSLYLLAEDSFWERNSIPPEDWAHETGMFTMVESTRTCPGQSCIPSDFYGNFPVVYFFPKLALSTLRGFAHFQLSNGEIPIYWGVNYERQNPVYQLLHVTSSCNYVDIVDRLWQRTGDDRIVHELYQSVKSAINYLQSLDSDVDALIDCHPGESHGHQFYNSWLWYGAAVHVVGIWLSVLLMGERMAKKMGDYTFAHDCRVWFNLGTCSLEEKLWNGKYYLLYNDINTNRKSDTILSNQLCGEWCARLHGTESVFPGDRINIVLETVKKTCIPPAKWGAAGAISPDGNIDRSGGETSEATFTPENLILAMTMLYAGDAETGTEIARQTMHNLVLEQGLAWDMPNMIATETGQHVHGNDFDQMMIIWALPVAIMRQSIAEFSAPGNLIDRIIEAGKIS